MWKLARVSWSFRQARWVSVSIRGPCIVSKRGTDILHDPWFNKDTAFPLTERDRLGLRGLLPPRVISFEQQHQRFNLGLQQPRLEGDEYLSIVDEFMEAAFARWPKAVIQFEDFQMKWAFETLQRYRENFCMFNDDIQGTAGVVLAGLLGAVRAQGGSLNDFMKQKIVVVGAGRVFLQRRGKSLTLQLLHLLVAMVQRKSKDLKRVLAC